MTTIRSALILLTILLNTPALALERDALTIWINQDKGYNALGEIGQNFSKASGIPVTVATPEDLAVQFDRLATTSKGPDIGKAVSQRTYSVKPPARINSPGRATTATTTSMQGRRV